MKIKKVLATATSTVVALGLTVAVAPAAVAGPTATTPGAYNAVNPIRVLDTRSGSGAPKMAVASKATLTFTLPVIPADSVVLEVTAVSPQAKGYLTVFPAGNPRPTASNLNFQAGQNVPNLVLTELGAGRTVSIFNGSASTVNLLADLHGYFQQGMTTGAGGTFDAMTPVRFLDTRSGLGTAAKGKVTPKSVTKINVARLRGVPVNATSVALNVTAVQSPGQGLHHRLRGRTPAHRLQPQLRTPPGPREPVSAGDRSGRNHLALQRLALRGRSAGRCQRLLRRRRRRGRR